MSEEIIVKTVLGFYPDAQAIYLFGSYLTPDELVDSDADIAILFSHNESKLRGSLVMSKCRIELESNLKRTVDLINLRQVNTVFQNEIIQQGRLIYKLNDYVIDEFEMLVMSSYQKLNEERSGILADIFKTRRILG
jgi:predicted nucleotidyltransferase